MEKRFSLPRLEKPSLNGKPTLHYVYIIKKHGGEPERIRCVSIVGEILLLEIVDEKDSPTGDWIQLTHEDYVNNYTMVKAVTSEIELLRLSIEMAPFSIRL